MSKVRNKTYKNMDCGFEDMQNCNYSLLHIQILHFKAISFDCLRLRLHNFQFKETGLYENAIGGEFLGNIEFYRATDTFSGII